MSAQIAALTAMAAADRPADSPGRAEGAEYDPTYVTAVLREDPALFKKAEMLKDAYVDALVGTVLRYLNNTVGCEGVLGRITYDPEYDNDETDDPDTYDDNVMHGVCLTTNRASKLFVGRDGYFPQEPSSPPYLAANTLRAHESPSSVDPEVVTFAAPVVLSEDCLLKAHGKCWGVIMIAWNRAPAASPVADAADAAAEDDDDEPMRSVRNDVLALAETVAALVSHYVRAELLESESLLSEALRDKAEGAALAVSAAAAAASAGPRAVKHEKMMIERIFETDAKEDVVHATNTPGVASSHPRRSRLSSSGSNAAADASRAPPEHHVSDDPAHETYATRQGSWRDAVQLVDDDGEAIDTAPVNYKTSVAVAAAATRRAYAAVSAIEKSTSLKAQVSELRRYHTANRTVVGVVCATLILLGEDIDILLSEEGGGVEGEEARRVVPTHPQKLQLCWTHVKKKMHHIRRGPGIQNAPFTTRWGVPITCTTSQPGPISVSVSSCAHFDATCWCRNNRWSTAAKIAGCRARTLR